MKKKHSRMTKGKPPQIIESKCERRNIRWIFGGAIVVGLAISMMIVFGLQTPVLTASDKLFLLDYEQSRVALAHDDLNAAKLAFAPLDGQSENIRETAAKLKISDSLASARQAFKVLSEKAVKLARKQPGYYVVQCIEPCQEHCSSCPMDDFGAWVQATPEVGNPFLGQAKLHCGRVSNL